ncbi:hypothetical protein HK101_009192, partial [Irineochytrium annulatum]
YNLTSNYDQSVTFNFYLNGDIGMQIGGAAFNGRYPLTGGSVDPNNPPQIQLSPDGTVYVEDSTGAVLKQLTPSTSIGFGAVNGPFVFTVDYDRRLRLRNSDTKKSILWSFPPPRTTVTPLRTDAVNFLASGEKLSSPSGQWWISVNTQGVLVTSAAYSFNAVVQTATIQPLVLQVNKDGSLRLYDALGRVHAVPIFPGSTDDASGQIFELQVTDTGVLQLLNALSNVLVWGFDLTKNSTVAITPTSTTPTPSRTPTPTATAGNTWTSTQPALVQPGYNLVSSYDDSVQFSFFSNGDIGIQIGGALFNGRTALTGGIVDPDNIPSLNLSADGHIYLKDSKSNILSELTKPQANGLGVANGPFVLTVDFDRRLRLRNSDLFKTIIWSFPLPRTSAPNLDTNSISFLASQETMSSPSGRYTLTLTTDGILTTSAGYAFNSNPQTINPQPYVLVLNADGSLGLYDALGQLHPVQSLPGPAPAGKASEYVLQITDAGALQVVDALADTPTWTFYITTNSTKPPAPTTTTPTPTRASTTAPTTVTTVPPPPTLTKPATTPTGTWRALSGAGGQNCVTNAGSSASLAPCNNAAAQLWYWRNGRLISQVPGAGGAALCADAGSLAVAPCSGTFNAWLYDAAGHAFKVSGTCLTEAGGSLRFSDCGATDGSQYWNYA